MHLVDRDGGDIPWNSFTESGRLYQSVFPLSRFVHLRVLTDMVNVEWKTARHFQFGGKYAIPIQRFPSGGKRYAEIGMNHVNPLSGKLSPELHKEVVSRPLKCVLLIPCDHVQKTSGAAMLLRCIGDYYERIGLFALQFVGEILDVDGNLERFVMSNDHDVAIEGFHFEREWVRLG